MSKKQQTIDTYNATAPEISSGELIRINPVLSDFFGIDEAEKLQNSVQSDTIEDFLVKFNRYFYENPEKTWTSSQIVAMFNELAGIVLAKNPVGSLKTKVLKICEALIRKTSVNTQLMDVICQMKLYFEINSVTQRDSIYTGQSIAEVNSDIIDVKLAA